MHAAQGSRIRDEDDVVDDEQTRPAIGQPDGALTAVGDALRASWQAPTDTMITDDIPLLLTRLSKVPPVTGGS